VSVAKSGLGAAKWLSRLLVTRWVPKAVGTHRYIKFTFSEERGESQRDVVYLG
jgi:hypothetical protein